MHRRNYCNDTHIPDYSTGLVFCSVAPFPPHSTYTLFSSRSSGTGATRARLGQLIGDNREQSSKSDGSQGPCSKLCEKNSSASASQQRAAQGTWTGQAGRQARDGHGICRSLLKETAGYIAGYEVRPCVLRVHITPHFLHAACTLLVISISACQSESNKGVRWERNEDGCNIVDCV